jgi:hypothetical protein
MFKTISIISMAVVMLFSISMAQTYEAEKSSMTYPATIQAFWEADVVTPSRYSGGMSIRIACTAVGDYCEWSLQSVPIGVYNVTFYYKALDIRAQVQASINGISQGPVIDMYNHVEQYQVPANLGLRTVSNAGNLAFRLTVTGRNTFSTGFSMQIDKIVLSPAIGGDSISCRTMNVIGDIRCRKIFVNNWSIEAPDYVFAPEYNLRPLADVETYIKQNNHLPEVPSAAEIKKNGVEIQEMNMTLLKKVEELTLYTIELNKKIEQLRQIR